MKIICKLTIPKIRHFRLLKIKLIYINNYFYLILLSKIKLSKINEEKKFLNNDFFPLSVTR